MAKNTSNNKKRPKLITTTELIIASAVVFLVLYIMFPNKKTTTGSTPKQSDTIQIEKTENKNPTTNNSDQIKINQETDNKTEDKTQNISPSVDNPVKYTTLQTVELLLLQQKTDAALQKLITYRKKKQDKEYPLRRGIEIALYAKNDQLARQWLKEAWAKYPNDTLLTDNIFSLIWLDISQGNYQQALEDLKYWQTIAQDNPADYANLYAQCASKINDQNEAKYLYNLLKKHTNTKFTATQKEKAAFAAELTGNLLAKNHKLKAIEMYELGYKWGNKQCINNAVTCSKELGNTQKTAQLLELLLENKEPTNNDYTYWLMLADTEQNNPTKAKEYVEKAYTLTPQEPEAVLHTGWYLINQQPKHKNTLEKFLDKHSNLAKNNPKLQDMYIVGNMRLKNYDAALNWYDLASDRHKNDLKWIYDYSNTLKTAGYDNKANRMQNNLAKYGLSEKTLETLDSTAIYALSDLLFINYKNNGMPSLNRTLDTLKKTKPTISQETEKLTMHKAADYAIQNNDYEQLEEIHKQFKEKSIEIPVYQRVILANHNNNRKQLSEILEDEDSLGISLKVLVLSKLGRQKEAIELAKTANIENDKEKTQALRNWSKYLSAEAPSGTQTIAHYKDFTDIALFMLLQSYDRLFKYGTFGLSVAALKLLGNDQFAKKFNNEYEIKANLRLYNRGRPTRIEASYLYRQNGSNFALTAKQLFPFSNRFSTELNLWWNQRGQISGFTYALTKNNAVKLSSLYQFTQRWNLILDASWNEYRSLSDEHLAHGPSLQTTIIYKLFAQAPELWLWSEVLWVKLYSINNLPPAINNYYDENLPQITSLFPDNYAHLYWGFTYKKSYPGLLVHTSKSPHYVIKPFVGYGITSQTLDWGLTIGIGTKIFGNDELSILGAYSSNSFGGFARKEIKLQYNINF